MFRALGRRFYRIQGDLSLAFAVNLWRDLDGSVYPKTQLPTLKNVTDNIGVGLENLYVSTIPHSLCPLTGPASALTGGFNLLQQDQSTVPF